MSKKGLPTCPVCGIRTMNYYRGKPSQAMQIGICTHCLRSEPLDNIPEVFELWGKEVKLRELIHNVRKEKNKKYFKSHRERNDYNAYQNEYRRKKRERQKLAEEII